MCTDDKNVFYLGCYHTFHQCTPFTQCLPSYPSIWPQTLTQKSTIMQQEVNVQRNNVLNFTPVILVHPWQIPLWSSFCYLKVSPILKLLEGAAHYAGLLLAPAEGFGLWPMPFFCPTGNKKSFHVCFGPNFGNFWWSVVTSVTFSSYLSNF